MKFRQLILLSGLTTFSFSMLSSCQAAPQQELTAADFRGPDGLIYPNFTFAGVPGGIPEHPVKAKIAQFGGKLDSDIADALEKGAAVIGGQGGGALLLEAGTYYLDRPILISADNVVVRGAGRDKTKIVFRWQPPQNGVALLGASDGEAIPANRVLTAAAWNDSKDNVVSKNLKRVALEINGQLAAEQKSGEGPWFAVSPDNRKSAALFREGENRIRALAEWIDGKTVERTIKVTVSKDSTLIAAAPTESAITFAEPGGGRIEWAEGELARLPRRGDTSLEFVQPQKVFQPGAIFKIVWPGGGWLGHPIHTVKSVEGTRVILVEPLRHTMDKVSSVRKLAMIRGCGVEDLTLTQTGNHWTNLLNFTNDAGCWVKGVRLLEAGRFPIMGGTKNFELRDSVVEGVRFHFGVGGGTGYLGFSGGQDGLIDNVQTKRLRHAPNLQFGAQGNVIRNSVFEDSDLQFHRDPTWDNLIENCIIRSRGSNKFYGSYGSAITITTATQGDLGARNVVWNNDFVSDTIYKGGSAISIKGGTMQNWIIAHNRFVHDVGFVLKAEGSGHDLTLRNNVFSVREPDKTLFKGDVTGLKLSGNQFYNLTGGTFGSPVALDENNRFEKTGAPQDTPQRPQAPVTSLFEWQKQQAAQTGAAPRPLR